MTLQELYALWERGELRAYFDAQTPDAGAIEAGLRDGRFVRDERLKQLLARRDLGQDKDRG